MARTTQPTGDIAVTDSHDKRVPWKRSRAPHAANAVGNGGRVTTVAAEQDVTNNDAFPIEVGGPRPGGLLLAAKAVKKTQLVEALAQQAVTGKRIGQLPA